MTDSGDGPVFDGGLADANDATLRAAVAHADLPALLPALATATGDLALVPPDLAPQTAGTMDPTFGLNPDQIATGREIGFAALRLLRDQTRATADRTRATPAPSASSSTTGP